jgi:hypothetical protein
MSGCGEPAGAPVDETPSAEESLAPRVPAPPSAARPAKEPASLAELRQRPLYTFSEWDLDLYLRHTRETEPDLCKRVVRLGRQNIGQPYEIYLLGEFPFELYDPQPLYCLQKSDCVVFAEHTDAMALAHDGPSFFALLQRIRYNQGRIGVRWRNHFTLADWDRNNAWLFKDVTKTLGGGKLWVELHQVCKRARFFRSRYNLDVAIPDETIVDAYIPRANVPAILGELRDGDLVHIIRGDADSQWAGHVGLIALGPDGTVDFLHSAKPRVREQPLLDYVTANDRTLGIKILRLREGAEQIAWRELTRYSPGWPLRSRHRAGRALRPYGPDGSQSRPADRPDNTAGAVDSAPRGTRSSSDESR